MSDEKRVSGPVVIDPSEITELTQPLILEEQGEPLVVVLSYEVYQRLSRQHPPLSSREAQGIANRAVFGDLVGCAISSDEPIWVPAPVPHWRVPYRHWNGKLLTIIEVDAETGDTNLTAEARQKLLDEVQTQTAIDDAASAP